MFSQRAIRYLKTLERRPHVEDLGVVSEALSRDGVRTTDAFVELHAAIAGYVEPAGKDEFVYGVVHLDSYWYGALTPHTFEDSGRWYAGYADAHPSYERLMDDAGVLYQEGGARRAASFVCMIEQHAAIAEFWDSGPTQRMSVRVPPNARHELVARLEPLIMRDASDRVATVWATDGFRLLATEASEWLLWTRPGVAIPELSPFMP